MTFSLDGAKKFGKQLLGIIDAGQQIDPNQSGWNYDGVTVGMLATSGDKPARNRIQIYEKWHRHDG
ncbi:hypothetical protein BJP27_24605 (plasmid) [Pseudomonas oryzihabitans]|nr:hypothetical protein BJP27_24605 [Pseudomonas psychrotolerans]